MALTKITSSVVAVNSLTVANIADNAVDATKIASNSILTRHIDDNQIGIDQLNVSDGSSGQALTTNGSGTLSFASVGISGISSSADATAITIDSSERVGILTTSPQRVLHVVGPDGTTSLTEGNSRTALFLDNAGATYINLASSNSANAGLFFSDPDANNRGGVIYEHGNDALTFDTAGAERLRILSAGGITFNGDTAAANALDDYEEGTWTPTINAGSLDGNQVGTYTKVGRKVTLQFYINVTTLGSSGSGILVQNLPFTSANITSGHVAGSVVGRYFTLNDLNLLIPPNQAYIQFWNNGSGDFDQVTFGEVEPSYDADFACYGTITYFAA